MGNKTIREIAAIAGVSVSTVSKVLNNKSDVGQATRDRVLDVVGRYNYRRRVSAVKGRLIGVFFPFRETQRLSTPYTSNLVFGAADYLLQLDYRLELISVFSVPRTPREFLSYCTQANIQAALFVLSTVEDVYIGELARSMPVVATALSAPGTPATTVCYDAYAACTDAVAHLVSLGHRRIGFLCEDQVHRDQILRYRSFCDSMADVDPDYHPPVLLDVAHGAHTDIGHFLEHALRGTDAPTAFVASNDLTAMRVLDALDSMGVSVPEQISLVGFDDLPFARHLRPPLTTVSQPTHDIGELAAAEIHRQLSGDLTQQGQEILLRGALIVRGSTTTA